MRPYFATIITGLSFTIRNSLLQLGQIRGATKILSIREPTTEQSPQFGHSMVLSLGVVSFVSRFVVGANEKGTGALLPVLGG